MKKLLFLMAALLPMMVFTSCSDDDDDSTTPFDVSTITGTWEITDVSGNSEWYWIAQGKTLKFNSDGTCETGHYMENSYKIENGQVKTYCEDNDEPMLVYTLLSKNAGTLTVRVSGTLDESNLSVVIQIQKVL